MYIVEMNDLTIEVRQSGEDSTWVMEIELCEATSIGQRITNTKILARALKRLYTLMAAQGISSVEQDAVRGRIFEVITEHPLELV